MKASSYNEVLASVEAAKRLYADKVIEYDRALNAAQKEGNKSKLVLWHIRIKRDLRNPEIQRVICEAAARNDLKFFKSLGKILEEKNPPSNIYQKDAFIEVLLKYWCHPAQDKPDSFCHWSDPALAWWFAHKIQGLNEKTIRKRWERLGLKKGKITFSLAQAKKLTSGPECKN